MKRNDRIAFLTVVAAAIFASCTTQTTIQLPETRPVVVSANAVNINSATAQELERIPNIGPKLASEIVDFRERHGRFRKPEYLMLVRSFSDTRYRQVKDFIKTE